MARPTTPINLTPEPNHILNRIARSRETPHSLVRRAQIIRPAAPGITNKTLHLNLNRCEDTVGLWRQRWVKGGAEWEKSADKKPKELRLAIGQLLADRARPGSPGKFSAEPVCQFIALACETPPEHLSHWTPKDLVREAVKRGIAESLSTSIAGRFLNSGRAQAAPDKVLAQS